jgi:hypothetical protein
MASRATAAEVPVTEPADDAAHSGRLLLRMPQSLHSELARAAEREGVSLNAYITSALASSVGWRSETGEGGGGGRRAPRLLQIALVADVVLVAAAVCVALVLLVSSL